jgi:hypothetical protein
MVCDHRLMLGAAQDELAKDLVRYRHRPTVGADHAVALGPPGQELLERPHIGASALPGQRLPIGVPVAVDLACQLGR